MENFNYSPSRKIRKPNKNIWVCPFTGKEINSRGVPAYLRNKYKLRWKQEYLTNPGLLRKRKEPYTRLPVYRNAKEIFADIEFDEVDIINAKVMDKYVFLTVEIRRALCDNDKNKLIKISKILSGFTFTGSNL